MRTRQSLSNGAVFHSKEINFLLGNVTKIVSNINHMNLAVASATKELQTDALQRYLAVWMS
ncbi:hypothetical protein L2729_03165 [Shewanella gelidimarina]|uniref:hypothetical protein n=1 Tax=Shewanella gelidimarina TaxID=56813 RepID=UPI00200D1C42|nr:hypothetical protein [Shewanella gelidimarina]MCL1056993.1 hypothetical protein [Shewanella gelidimarina]